MDKWQRELPNLKAERVLKEQSEKALVENFRLRHFGRIFLECMREEAAENRVEKEKDAFKKALRSKVSSWLTEIDSRPAAAQDDQDPWP